MSMIAIEGVIGVGKTSLARYLSQELAATLVLEVFDENPFLSAFYQDRDRYAFQTQMFFLLSRYQQMRDLEKLPRPLVSDYMFQKDRLFATQTLRGDEMGMYERVYSALLENTEPPDLIIYLRADTDVLMRRIAIRDRAYERNMDIDYIDGLRIAYDKFFAHYDPHKHLMIDTSQLDFVNREEDRQYVLQRILSRLGATPLQPTLPGLDLEPVLFFSPEGDTTALTTPAQEEVAGNATGDMLFQMLLLQEGMGNLGKIMRQQWQTNRHNKKKVLELTTEMMTALYQLAQAAKVDSAQLQQIMADLTPNGRV